MLGIANVASITVLAFLVGLCWKNASALDDKWIPCVCGIVGLILGIAAFYIKIPDFPAQDVITAAAVGVVSGFAATGIHQIKKQLCKSEDDQNGPYVEPEDETSDDEEADPQ